MRPGTALGRAPPQPPPGSRTATRRSFLSRRRPAPRSAPPPGAAAPRTVSTARPRRRPRRPAAALRPRCSTAATRTRPTGCADPSPDTGLPGSSAILLPVGRVPVTRSRGAGLPRVGRETRRAAGCHLLVGVPLQTRPWIAGSGLSSVSWRQACSWRPASACASQACMFSPAGQPALHGGSRSTYTGRRSLTGPAVARTCSKSGSGAMSGRTRGSTTPPHNARPATTILSPRRRSQGPTSPDITDVRPGRFQPLALSGGCPGDQRGE